MSNKPSNPNKRARAIVLSIILITVGIVGTLYPLSGLLMRDTNEQTEGGEPKEGASVNTPGTTRKEYTLIAQDAELQIAPGHVIKAWTFNGTMPGPTLRFTEGDNVTIKFINKTPIPHTIHFHGNHDDANDGVRPQIMPNQTYLYNITAAPAGALMYHCHAMPTSLHIRMGMYGALIVDPKDKPLPPAREFVMVMSEYDDENIMKFETEYYPINGYTDQYILNPIIINNGELLRIYLINLGTTIPYQFHLHSTTFKAYPSGLLSNEPIDAQTIPVGPGDAAIIEAKWKYPGTYLFHSHGIQEERGNMGQIVVAENGQNNNQPGADNDTGTSSSSISMFDWQYQIQKKLQNPRIINYSDAELTAAQGDMSKNNNSHMMVHDNTTTYTEPTANASKANIQEQQQHRQPHNSNNDESSSSGGGGGGAPGNLEVSIAKGAANPSNEVFYDPSPATLKRGSTIIWTNNDSTPHTATSGNPDSGEAARGTLFDTGIIGPGQSSEGSTIDADAGTYNYDCTLHPFMKGQLKIVE